MEQDQKKKLSRIIIVLILFILLLIFDKTGFAEIYNLNGIPLFIMYLAVYLIIGYDILLESFENIRNGHIFDENFLMMIATFAAFAVGEYSEALAVMLFYQTGELFEDIAVGKSRKSITDMMNIAPEYANLEQEGSVKRVDPASVTVGSTIIILPGERIPLDGVVTEGDSFVDTSALTGESVPRHITKGSDVISGCVNAQGTVKVRVTSTYSNSTVSRILELVENAGSKKAHLENFITRFASYYTPIVTITALLVAIIPPLVLGGGFGTWISRACIFLIVSCPCALVISVPLGFFGGIGAESKNGILVKGSNFLEVIAQTDTIVFDKTGTLTKGEFKVQELHPAPGFTEKELLLLAAHAEMRSNHPIAASIRAAAENSTAQTDISADIGSSSEKAGHGISTIWDGHTLLAGNALLMQSEQVKGFNEASDSFPKGGTVVYVAKDLQYAGSIIISDTIKDNAAAAISEMKAANVNRIVMLTGDNESSAAYIASAIGIDEVHAGLLPEDKVKILEQLLQEEKGSGKVAFAGDGINDAPVLIRADAGIAMGSLGSAAAVEAADIVLMDDDLGKIPAAIRIARKTIGIVHQNIAFALIVKIAVMILGIFGLANMWEAVFADVGVALIAIVNSMRTLKN